MRGDGGLAVERWIVTSAWPYAHGVPHLGNLIGSLLSADIFTRYLRLKGHDVILVSGSDEHGTPIEVRAIKEGREPEDLTSEVHNKIVEILNGFNIEFDNYTRTHSDVHISFTQEFYMKIYNNGYIFTREDEIPYCERDKLFLPDRFVTGTCPYCGYENARGDQCENCGKLLNPVDLVNPRCSICGGTPIIKRTRHYYFDLPKLTDKLMEFIEGSETLTENAKNFSLNMLREGLKPRSITRNNRWGIPAPFPGAEGLTIYVWFEAVLGYVSAVKEYFMKKYGDGDKWREWWFDKDTNVAFFIGKDNIPFHTIIFPALLMATGDPYTLKFYIGATEYLNFEGKKFSKSQGIGIWCDEALKLLPADYWRFALTYMRPETKDTNFTWESFETIINEELNNHFGNLVHRILNLIKMAGGRIGRRGPTTREQEDVLRLIDEVAGKCDKLYMDTRFQRVIHEALRIVKAANHLINVERPWDKIKAGDVEGYESTLYTCFRAAKAATIILYPIIPASCRTILRYFNLDPDRVSWEGIYVLDEEVSIDMGFKPVFMKIDKDELKRRLVELRASGDSMERIDIDYLRKIVMKVGTVKRVERKPGTRNIYRIYVDIGDRVVKLLAGLVPYYREDELLGKRVVVILNMKPKKIRDEVSDAMILAAEDESGRVRVLTVDGEVSDGASVR